MADLSKIKLNGTTYNFKDNMARTLVIPITTGENQELVPGIPLNEAIEAFLLGRRIVLRNNNYDLYIDHYDQDSGELNGTSNNPNGGGYTHITWDESGINVSNITPQETDPTVPEWAKQSTKPTYTASEVGALPDTYVPPEEVMVVTFTKVDETSYTADKTFDEVLAAKYAVARALNNSSTYWWYVITSATSSTMAFSRQQGGKHSSFIWMKSSGNITYSSQNLERQSFKVTEITSSSTDNQYPSAKATYDFITSALSDITGFSVEVVQSLPATGEQGIFYFIPNSGSGNNIYDEYVYVNNAFEKIGSTEIDLSNYLQTTDIADWAKAATKPAYTASEVGAAASSHTHTFISSVSGNFSASFSTSAGSTSPATISIKGEAGSGAIKTDTLTFKSTMGEGVRISNVADPRANKDAANKQYVDNAIAGITPTESDPVFTASAAAGITAGDINNWNAKSDFSGSYEDLTDKPTIPTVPSNVSAFTNDAGYLTSFTETDPTVPAWAKAANKPTYTAMEVGALPNTYTAPVTSVNGATGTPKTSFYVTITGDSATGYTADKTFDQVAAAYEAGYAVYAINGLSILSLSMVRYSEEQISNISFSRTGGSQIYTFIWAKNSNSIVYSSVNISNYVPTSRTINNKALTSDITLTASDVGALPDSTVIPAAQVQSDWNVTTGMGAILNKPTIPTVPSNVSAFTNDAGYLTSYTETDPTVPAWAKASTKPAYTAAEVGALPSDTAIPSKVSDLNNDTGFITSAALPTKVSDLDNDAGYLTSFTETDPVFGASAAAGISSADITNWNSKTNNTGTVTSVRVQATAPVQSSVSTAQNTTLNTTISLASGYGDTQNPYTSKTAKYVLAAPNAQNGVPTFRALVASDLPSIGNITNGGDITANATIANGDRLIINDESASKVINSSITFGTNTKQYLANNGTWQNAYDDSALAARVTALEELEWATYYSGRSNPSNTQGKNGDIYLQY